MSNDNRTESTPLCDQRRGCGRPGLGGFGFAGLGGRGKSFAEEPPPEITTIRLEKDPVTCIAPQVVQELLRDEGFTDIRYVELTEAYLRKSPASPADYARARRG